MQTFLLVAVLFCLVHTGLFGESQPGPSRLDSEIDAIVSAHHGEVAFYAENLATHQVVSRLPDIPVQTASVIKLAILYEALEQIRESKVHFEDRISLTKPEQVQGSGVLLFCDTPLTLSFKDVLTMMVVMSDNTATNLAIDHLGLMNIQARIGKLELKDTWLYKKVFTPVPLGMIMPADYKRFGIGKTTAREMADLMMRFVRCELAEPGTSALPGDAVLCQTAMKMLHLQFYRTGIPRYLDGLPGATEDSIANKTGSLDAVRNDVGAVSTPNGMVILSIFTFNNKDHSWTQDQEAELTIAKLARAIVAEWSPAGLAPAPRIGAAPPAGSK
jgi:beta-lactamase class A